MSTFSITCFILLGICSLVQVVISENINVCGQELPSNAKFEANQQIFNFYGPCSKQKNEIPNGYKSTSGYGAYKFHKETKSWNEAKKVCVSEGAQLAVFTSLEEISLIQRALPENGVKHVWVGYHDLFQEGDWTTVWDKPIGYAGIVTSFWPNQPDNYKGIQHCGLLDVNGMDDSTCTTNLPFLCKFSSNDCNSS